MVDIFDFGGPQSGLADVKVAVNNGDGTFGSMVDVPSVQLLGIELRTESAELNGDDRITATRSRIVGANITLRYGSIHLDVLETMLGNSVVDSYGSYSSRRVYVTNRKLPNFGICGKANAEEGGGDTHLFAPRCKVSSNFNLRFEYNTFSIPEMTLAAVGDENFLDDNGDAIVVIPVEYETARDVAIPPL